MTMLPIKAWKVWYDGGKVYRSTETTWDALPEHGVQAVCYYHGDGYRTFAHGLDEYRFWGQPRSAVKYGRLMDETEYRRLFDTARAEKERLG